MRCIHCGEEVPRRAETCPGCGAVTGNKKKKEKKKKKVKLVLILAIVAVVVVIAFLGIYHLVKVATIHKYIPLAEAALAEEDYEEAIECYMEIARPYRDVPEVHKALAETLIIAYEKDDMFEYDRLYDDFHDTYRYYGKYVGEYDSMLYSELEELDARIKEENKLE